MKPATPEQIARIVRHIAAEPDTLTRAVLSLVTHPRTWVHFTPTDLGIGGNLEGQMDALVTHAKAAGHRITTLVIPGDPDGGFYGMLL
jgi:hypothetical protein